MAGEFTTNKDSTLWFPYLLANGEGFYVLARRALLNRYVVPGWICAEQAVELLANGVVRQVTDGPAHGRHGLRDFFDRFKDDVPYFAEVVSNPDLVSFLDGLSEGYAELRYGNAGFGIDVDPAIPRLDELVNKLRALYLESLKAPQTRMYVAPDDQEALLRGNHLFTLTDITGHPMAALLPLPTIPPFPWPATPSRFSAPKARWASRSTCAWLGFLGWIIGYPLEISYHTYPKPPHRR